MKLIQSGKVFMILNDNGEFWLGPREPISAQWQAPGEPGADVPCWMTTSKEAAEAQAALLEANPEPSMWSKIADELYRDAELWRTDGNDPNNVNYAVSTALRAVSLSISKCI